MSRIFEIILAVPRFSRWMWRQWPLVTAMWFVCAIWVTAALKAATHKGLFSVVGNGFLGSALLAPFAFLKLELQYIESVPSEIAVTDSIEVAPHGMVGSDSAIDESHPQCSLRFTDLTPLRKNLGLTVLIAVFTGLNRTFTNCSLYFIDAWLKTALLTLACPLTFIFGAMVKSHGKYIDARARDVLCLCRKRQLNSDDSNRFRSTIAMIPALVLITIGGVVIALPKSSRVEENAAPWQMNIDESLGSRGHYYLDYGVGSYTFGICLQMLSNCFGALQNVFTKVLLNDARDKVSDHNAPSLNSMPPVSKAQIALLTQPVIGVLGFFSVLVFEHSDFGCPPLLSLVIFSFGVLGIVITELRLVELTSALTLAVLSASHNVIMVFFFLAFDGEGRDISFTEGVGYAVNTVGFVLYAGVRYWQQQDDLSSRRLSRATEREATLSRTPDLLQHDSHDGRQSGYPR